MAGEMSIRERMMAVYRNQMPDQFPVGIYSRYLQRGTVERELRNQGLGIIEYYPTATFLGPAWHSIPSFLSEIENCNLRVEHRWEKGSYVERNVIETPVGTLWQDKEKSLGFGSEHIKKHWITELEDYKIMTYVMEHTVVKSHKKDISECKRVLGEDGVVLGRIERCPYQKILVELASPNDFLVDLYMEPEIVETLFEVMYRKLWNNFDLVLDNDCDVIWNTENLTADLTPPNLYEKYVKPYHDEVGRRIKEAGKTYVVHCDGKLNALKELLRSSYIDCIESFSLPVVSGDMEFADARELFKGKVLLPNFPANYSIRSDEEILRFMGELKEMVGNDNPFMLQVSEDLADGEWDRVLKLIVSEMYGWVGNRG